MNIGATSSAVDLGQILKNSQQMQMDFVEKVLKTQMTIALDTNPAVGSMLDTIA